MKKAFITGISGQDGPCLANLLIGVPTKAKNKLNWEAKIGAHHLSRLMVQEDLKIVHNQMKEVKSKSFLIHENNGRTV